MVGISIPKNGRLYLEFMATSINAFIFRDAKKFLLIFSIITLVTLIGHLNIMEHRLTKQP